MYNKQRSLTGLWFVLPSLAILTLIAIWPILYSGWLSLTSHDGFSSTFIGLGNYWRMLHDQNLWASLWHTIIFVIIAVPLQIGIPLALAELLARTKVRWLSGFVRSVLFVPVIASLILVGTVWQFLLASNNGLLNVILDTIGLDKVNFLGNPALALISVALVSVWKNIGYFLVIFYAAVLDVPTSLYEAAKMDGAGAIRRFFHVTVPGVRNVTFLVLVLSTIWSFQVFDLVYIMTGGGPGGATTTIVMSIYEQGFKSYNMGYASAIAMLLLAIVVVISVVQRAIFSRTENV